MNGIRGFAISILFICAHSFQSFGPYFRHPLTFSIDTQQNGNLMKSESDQLDWWFDSAKCQWQFLDNNDGFWEKLTYETKPFDEVFGADDYVTARRSYPVSARSLRKKEWMRIPKVFGVLLRIECMIMDYNGVWSRWHTHVVRYPEEDSPSSSIDDIVAESSHSSGTGTSVSFDASLAPGGAVSGISEIDSNQDMHLLEPLDIPGLESSSGSAPEDADDQFDDMADMPSESDHDVVTNQMEMVNPQTIQYEEEIRLEQEFQKPSNATDRNTKEEEYDNDGQDNSGEDAWTSSYVSYQDCILSVCAFILVLCLVGLMWKMHKNMHETKLNKMRDTMRNTMQKQDESDVTERYSIDRIEVDCNIDERETGNFNQDLLRIPIGSTSTASSLGTKNISEGSSITEATPKI